jgi:hypothetical protein
MTADFRVGLLGRLLRVTCVSLCLLLIPLPSLTLPHPLHSDPRRRTCPLQLHRVLLCLLPQLLVSPPHSGKPPRQPHSHRVAGRQLFWARECNTMHCCQLLYGQPRVLNNISWHVCFMSTLNLFGSLAKHSGPGVHPFWHARPSIQGRTVLLHHHATASQGAAAVCLLHPDQVHGASLFIEGCLIIQRIWGVGEWGRLLRAVRCRCLTRTPAPQRTSPVHWETSSKEYGKWGSGKSGWVGGVRFEHPYWCPPTPGTSRGPADA